jgi:hypothetical protein
MKKPSSQRKPRNGTVVNIKYGCSEGFDVNVLRI